MIRYILNTKVIFFISVRSFIRIFVLTRILVGFIHFSRVVRIFIDSSLFDYYRWYS